MPKSLLRRIKSHIRVSVKVGGNIKINRQNPLLWGNADRENIPHHFYNQSPNNTCNKMQDSHPIHKNMHIKRQG